MFNRVFELQTGDEVVYDFHQSIAVISVLSASEHTLKLRVATATKDVLARENLHSWLVWMQKGAPGASSDETFSVQKDTRSVSEVHDTQRVRWLITLLGLDLTPIPQTQRRRAGPPPLSGEIDLRPLFQPRIMVQGQKVETKSEAFSTRWPDDGSELSSRILILYFPSSSAAVSGFPYWIESPSSAYHVQAIDSARPL